MKTEKFFEKFPIITYGNNQVVDITRRVVLLDKVSSNPYVFYPYDIAPNERPDQLSARYYNDSYMSWIIYLTNKVVDPYYEWYMHDSEFSDFIIKKYGSEEKAKSKIKFYRNDWANTSTINQSAYNALSIGETKYWEPNILENYRPATSYKRKEIDWTITTNKIVTYKVTNSNKFILDERCEVWFDKDKIGYGQVVAAGNNSISLQHVTGYYYAEAFTTDLNYRISDEDNNYIVSDPSNPNTEFILYEYRKNITDESYIAGYESNTKTNIISCTITANNIPDEEVVYWKPVSYYDYEYEKNEYYKTIRVIDSNLKYTAVDNLRNLLEE